jgi:hypothetical protein
VKKLLPVSVLIGAVLFLSQWMRTSSVPSNTLAANQAVAAANQFVLKKNFPLNNDGKPLLTTIYSTGHGEKEQEVLSIWSAESDGYQLRYIRTADAGRTFVKPAVFTNQDISFGS